jgi:hypothetical protein
LYVLASATLGFSHRALPNAVAPELARFALPDGTLPVICGQNGAAEQDGSQKEHGGAHANDIGFCQACCLTSTSRPSFRADRKLSASNCSDASCMAAWQATDPPVFDRPYPRRAWAADSLISS